MNFADLPRYHIRDNSLSDVSVPFFDSADRHRWANQKKLANQKLRPVHYRRWKRARIAVCLIGISAGFWALSALSQTIASVTDDAAKRSSEIHWPAGLSPDNADLFAHNEIFINAPSSRVWQHIIEAPKWPEWYPNSRDVQIVNDQGSVLKADSKFEWSTFGPADLQHDSRVCS
jgi:hypothetical protein